MCYNVVRYNLCLRENRGIQETMYEDVLKKIVKDISFLRMKNNGNNLCSDMVEIEYIPYKFENLFM